MLELADGTVLSIYSSPVFPFNLAASGIKSDSLPPVPWSSIMTEPSGLGGHCLSLPIRGRAGTPDAHSAAAAMPPKPPSASISMIMSKRQDLKTSWQRSWPH